MWYSFEHGPIHITSLSSETDYKGEPSNEFADPPRNGNFGDQLAWVEADLKKADANRANVPWIIVGMHHPVEGLDPFPDRNNATCVVLLVLKTGNCRMN